MIRTVSGCFTSDSCPECQKEKEILEEKKREGLKIEIIKGIMENKRGVFPSVFDSASLEDFNGIFKESRSYLITGKCGTGKTHLAVALAKKKMVEYFGNDFDERGASKMYSLVEFVNFNKLTIKIKSSFSSNSTESMESILEKVSSYGLLVLDDIGASKPTDTAIESLYYITDSRYSENLRTIYTTNLSIAEISNQYGDRVASRLSACEQINLSGKDRRLQK